MDVLALHMSDGLVAPRTSAWFFATAALGLCIAAWCVRSDIDRRSVPTAAAVTALVFALQTVDVPVLPDVSGHVVGGALAAVLLGPCTGAVAVTIVLVVQAFVFADGGLSALGTNVTNMALAAVAAGFLTAVALRALFVRHGVRSAPLTLATMAFVAGFVSIFAAVTSFVVEYALGGATAVPLSNIGFLFAAHLPVGLVDGAVTAGVVVAAARSCPTSVYLLRDTPAGPGHRARSRGALLACLGFTALIVAGILAPLAVDTPGALEVATMRGCTESGVLTDTAVGRVTGECMGRGAVEHRLAGSALADYTVGGRPGSTGIAALLGTLATFVLAGVCFRALSSGPPHAPARAADAKRSTTAG